MHSNLTSACSRSAQELLARSTQERLKLCKSPLEKHITDGARLFFKEPKLGGQPPAENSSNAEQCEHVAPVPKLKLMVSGFSQELLYSFRMSQVMQASLSPWFSLCCGDVDVMESPGLVVHLWAPGKASVPGYPLVGSGLSLPAMEKVKVQRQKSGVHRHRQVSVWPMRIPVDQHGLLSVHPLGEMSFARKRVQSHSGAA
ncbi:unnamed protein product [Gadus morhua 'NCC']